MTRTQARAFRARWRRVALAESTALQRMSVSDRSRALAALMASHDAIGDARRLAAEDEVVRRRWSRLRRAARG
jgi:hypothetical protein